MDLTPLTKFISAHWLEFGGLFTLVVSLWIAFGPLRHRLPRFLTRLGKYSATLKLLTLSGICWYALYRCLTDEVPSAAINWMLGCLGTMLLCGAAFVITRKQVPSAHAAHAPASPAKPAMPPKSAAPAPRS